jgi:hypothetical protein
MLGILDMAEGNQAVFNCANMVSVAVDQTGKADR